jgi:hypothetical protein
MEADSTALSARRPEVLQDTLSYWLAGTRRLDSDLNPHAKLLPTLPPPGMQRTPLPLKPLDKEALRSFELKPMAPPSVPVAVSAAPAAAIELRQRIWELAHRVHDAYTAHWPHTWPRPAFAVDPANPAPHEWKPFAEKFIKSPGGGVKAQLERWRDAAETAPQTREALRLLIQKLGVYADKARQQREQKQEKLKQQREAEEAARRVDHDEEERHLERKLLYEKHALKIRQLHEEIEQVRSGRGARKAELLLELNNKLAQTNTDHFVAVQEMQRRHEAACGGATSHPAPRLDARAEPHAKRQR